MDARFCHLALNCLVTSGYAALLFTLIRQRLWTELPWFTVYIGIELAKHVIRDPYHHSPLYNWYQPFVIGLRALAALEAAVLAARGLPRWERLFYLVAAIGAAVFLFAITLRLQSEVDALRAFERHRQQVETGIGAFALLAALRLKWNRHLAVMTLYCCAYPITGFIDYRHAATAELRIRLYYLEAFSFLTVTLICLSFWLWLASCSVPRREARLALGG